MEKIQQEFKEGTSSYKLIIPKEVEAKIRYLCNVVHDLEWSGVLFYSYEGSFKDDSLVLICKDICVKDIGSSTFTEFKDAPDILNYRVTHDLLDPSIQEGLIHSHNTFSAFFSGTDVSTLKEEGEACNHFLSLIVNNEGNYVARITKKTITEKKAKAHIYYSEDMYYNTYSNDKVIIHAENKNEEDKEDKIEVHTIEWFPLDIQKEPADEEFVEINEQLAEIKKNKKAKASYVKNDIKYPVQKSLFEETHYYNDMPTYYGINNTKSESKKVLTITNKGYNESFIDAIAVQLLMGSIMKTEETNLYTAIRKSDELYAERFGDLHNKSNLDKAREWIDALSEYLLISDNESLVENIEYTDYEADLAQLCATYVINRLNSVHTTSIIKDEVISSLNMYLPYGINEYSSD